MERRMTVKQARVGVDMTQEEMAKALGVSTSTYASWEKKPLQFKVDKLQKFTEVTGVDVPYLKIWGEG